MDPEDICLDIAIDHRIKMLFGPFELNQSYAVAAPQSHVQLLTRLSRKVKRGNKPIPNEEVQVASELALPLSPGGMLIMLFQPANDHPYRLGTRVTVRSSPTLNTTDAMLRTVSCGTLTIDDVSLVDSLLFVRKCDNMSEAGKNTIRQNVYDIVVAKQPKGVLCMWSDKSATTEIKCLQSCGVGSSFPENVELPLGLATHRINAFHPSYAVNYNPEFSLLRQLLLLETAHGVQLCYNGDWQEREWMRDLRRKCKGVASQISGSNAYGSDYLSRWFSHLETCLTEITSILATDMKLPGYGQPALDLYNSLLRSDLTRLCNDASLCLREIGYQKTLVHPDDFTQHEPKAEAAVLACFEMLRGATTSLWSSTNPAVLNCTPKTRGIFPRNQLKLAVLKSSSSSLSGKYRKIIGKFFLRVNALFSPEHIRGQWRADLVQLSDEILRFAVNLEGLLGQMLERIDIGSSEEVDILGDVLAATKIA